MPDPLELRAPVKFHERLQRSPPISQAITTSRTFRWSLLAVAIIVSLVYLYSGVQHLKNPYQFYSAILKYDIVDLNVGRILAVFVPGLQIGCSVGIVAKRTRRKAAILLAMLTVVFAIAQAAALVRGLTIGCGCFGVVAGEKITWWTVARSVGLIAVLIGLALAGSGVSTSDTSDVTQGAVS